MARHAIYSILQTKQFSRSILPKITRCAPRRATRIIKCNDYTKKELKPLNRHIRKYAQLQKLQPVC